jgi:hypothetical protein
LNLPQRLVGGRFTIYKAIADFILFLKKKEKKNRFFPYGQQTNIIVNDF